MTLAPFVLRGGTLSSSWPHLRLGQKVRPAEADWVSSVRWPGAAPDKK